MKEIRYELSQKILDNLEEITSDIDESPNILFDALSIALISLAKMSDVDEETLQRNFSRIVGLIYEQE